MTNVRVQVLFHATLMFGDYKDVIDLMDGRKKFKLNLSHYPYDKRLYINGMVPVPYRVEVIRDHVWFYIIALHQN